MFHPLDATDIPAKMPRVTRIVLRLFGRRLNRDVFAPLLGRAHERQEISSRQLHVLAAQFDPTQGGVMGIATGRYPRRARINGAPRQA